MQINVAKWAVAVAGFAAAGLVVSAQQMVVTTGGQGPALVQGGVPGGFPADKPMETGSGIIFGRTIEAGSGRPLSGALVTLALPGAVPLRAMTDPQGQFAFQSLPKGHFSLNATRPGYVDGAYGRVRPAGPTQSVDLSDDQRVSGIAIPLWKFAAVAGTVVDERGEPIVGATVRVLKRSIAAGKRQLTNGASDTTDDRGAYRIGSLEPGDYAVVVPITQGTSWDSMFLGLDLPRDLPSMPAGGGGGNVAFTANVQIGSGGSTTSMVMLGGDASIAPAGKTEDGHLLTYQTEFYPGVLSGSRAATVTMAAGEERSGIDFQLKPVRTVGLSGTLMGPDGPVPNTSISLIPAEADDIVTSIETATTTSNGDGAFRFTDIPPGSYSLRVLKAPRMAMGPGTTTTVTQDGASFTTMTRTISNVGGGAPLPTEPTLWAESSIALGSTDVTGVTVSLRAGMRVSGRVEFNGAADRPTPDQMSRLSLSLEPADGRTASIAATARGRVESTGRFTTMGVPVGKYVLRVGAAPQGWSLLAATFAGRDITDAAVELKSDDIDGVVVSFTDRPTDVSGTVTNASGAPDVGAAVIVFPTDPAGWTGSGSSPRRLKNARTSTTGAYSFSNLPPGDYFIVAVSDALAGDWQNPEFLSAVSSTATRMQLGEGEKKIQALRTASVSGRQGGR